MGQVISRKQSLESKHCSTLGLYDSCSWDNKTLKKLIVEKKLAPIFTGADQKDDLEECPICMLYYPYLNTSTCCKKHICTECFLQVRKPGAGSETDCCPFCTSPNYNVTFNGRRSEALLKKEREEEIRVSTLERQATSRRPDEFSLGTKLSLEGGREGGGQGSSVRGGEGSGGGANVGAAVVLGPNESGRGDSEVSLQEDEEEGSNDGGNENEEGHEGEENNNNNDDEGDNNNNNNPGGNAGGPAVPLNPAALG